MTIKEAKEAVNATCKEREKYRQDIRQKGEEAWSFLEIKIRGCNSMR